MKTEHTKGDWNIDENTNHYPFIVDDRGQIIALLILEDGSLPYGREVEETKANAALISAAPELLEALKECRAWYEENSIRLAPETPICFSKALSAITKATNAH